jgi:SAM-dependent methyltransferase
MTKDLQNDIVQWDVNSWSRVFEIWESKLNAHPDMRGLELGGRQGGLTLWLALKGIKTICSDMENTEETAAPLHEKHQIGVLVEYQNIDATQIPFENYFDVIVFKSIIGGVGSNDNLEAQKAAFQQIYKALKPGGKLLFAENMVASPLHLFFRKRFVNWGARWRYVTLQEMRDFLQDFSNVELKTTGFFATFGRSESQRKFLSFFDRIIFNHITPKSWRYIGYGVAEK